MPAPELLLQILNAAGPSGHETDPARAWREGCRSFATEVRADHVGSSLARVAGTAGGPTLAIVGHIDEIGVHVSHIDDDGFLRFGEVGGWDQIVLVGQRVRIATRNGTIPGVIGRKPIHLMKGPDREKSPQIKDLHIDIGAKDADQAREMVRVGDVAVIDADPVDDAQRAARRAGPGQPDRLLRGRRGRAAGRRGGWRPRGCDRPGGGPGGDHLRRLAHERLRRRTRTSPSPSTSPSRPISLASSWDR